MPPVNCFLHYIQVSPFITEFMLKIAETQPLASQSKGQVDVIWESMLQEMILFSDTAKARKMWTTAVSPTH